MSWAAVAGAVISVGGAMLTSDGGEQATTEQQSTMTPEQRALLAQLIGTISSNPELGQQQFEPYGGELVSPLSKLETTSLAALEERAKQLFAGGSETDKASTDALGRILGGKGVATDEFIRTNVEQPATRFFNETLLPGITGRFAGSNLFGSDRREAEQRGARDLGETVSKTSADIRLQSEQQNVQNILAALGLAPAITGARTGELSALLAAGGIPRGVDQAKLAADYEEFLRRQKSKKAAFDQAIAALGLKGVENITTVPGGGGSFLGEVATGAGKALGTGVSQWLGSRNTSSAPSFNTGYYGQI